MSYATIEDVHGIPRSAMAKLEARLLPAEGEAYQRRCECRDRQRTIASMSWIDLE